MSGGMAVLGLFAGVLWGYGLGHPSTKVTFGCLMAGMLPMVILALLILGPL